MWDSWHSVGHLHTGHEIHGENNKTKANDAYLVQVPEARGNVIPEMASMSDDFPADCDPRTAMMGTSSSRLALQERS